MPLNQKQLKDLISASTKEPVDVIPYLVKNLHCKENEEAIVSSVNSLLRTSKTCLQGLEILTSILPHIRPEVITDHIITWIESCVVKYEDDSSKEPKLASLDIILRYIPAGDAFNKKITSEFLLDILKMILSSGGDSAKPIALKCLLQCLLRYPSWFGNHKSKVEDFLLLVIDSNNGKLIRQASLCFHHFQQTGSAGVEGVNYASNFEHTLRKMCTTVHHLYDILLKDVSEVESIQKPEGDYYTFDEHNESFQVFFTRLRNCIVFIETMIAKKYPVEKRIVPKEILDVIVRGLSVHVCLSEDDLSVERFNLALFLLKIQSELMRLLQVLIIGHLPALLPYNFQINKTLLNVLKRFQACPCSDSDLKYKKIAVKTMCKWISLSHGGNQVYLQNALISLVKKDVILQKKQVLLAYEGLAKKSKKKKVAVNNWEKSIASEPSQMDTLNKQNDCINALTILKCLLNNSSLHRIKSTDLQELINFTTSTLAAIQGGANIPPFKHIDCQLLLYSVITNLLRQENVSCLPPMHSIGILLNAGVKNPNANVQNICRQGLDLLECISQPVCPSMFICHSIYEEKNAEIIEEQKNDDDVEIIEVEDKYEENTSKTNKVNILSQITIAPNDAPVTEKNHEKEEQIEDAFLAWTNSSQVTNPSENDVDEPPSKKSKEDGNLLEMCDSFQDVV